MRIRFMLRSLLVLALLLAAPASAAPEVGERAPDFRFLGEGRREVRFEDYFGGTAGSEAKADDVGSATGVAGETAGEGGGRRGVVIAWFPKAFTPG